MSEKYILIEHLSILNEIIGKTFETTNRIKFTCFDVSKNYIVFGSTNGGIYIFKRKPCQFLKLIPSKDGASTLIAISENEKNIALVNAKGLIIVIENCFNGTNFQYNVYAKHEGQTVTCIKWDKNDLYSGDNTGKISVITLLNFLTKTIFQTSVTSLMHLDSPIIQLDVYLKYLLVSTQTRTYLCDTVKEQYRQIGKKLRNGPYGACFFNVDKSVENNQFNSIRGLFKTVEDNEEFSTHFVNNNNIKIYCTRPGVRLWEVNFQGSVVFTYQFRDSLNQNPCSLIRLDDDNEDTCLEISNFNDTEKVVDNFNFERIYVFCDKFLLTYKNDSFYIFDPNSTKLLFWCNAFNNNKIKDIRIVDTFLYIWLNNYQIKVISLYTIEELVLKTLLNKQYSLCGELCVHFMDDILSLIDTSKRIHLIQVLKSKLLELNRNDLLEKLSPIINKFKENLLEEKKLGKKLSNGIVLVVNNTSIKADNNLNTFQETEINGKITKSKANIKNSNSKTDNDLKLNILYKQFKINKIHENIVINDVTNLLNSMNFSEILNIFEDFSIYVNNLENTDCKLWCQTLFLRHLSQLPKPNKSDDKVLNYAIEAYFSLNSSLKNLGCNCGFPLPLTQKTKPKFYELGCELMDNSSDNKKFTLNIPYMYRNSLNKLNNFNEIQSNLSLLIQFSDLSLIENILTMFTYDLWDESLRYLTKLRKGVCLNCSKAISLEGVFSWKTYSLFIVRSIDGTNAIKLLKHYSNSVPNGELDAGFYQFVMFRTITKQKPMGKIDSSILDDHLSSEQLENFVAKCLQKNYNNSNSHHNSILTTSYPLCSYCNLCLNYPNNEIENNKLGCGHNYHSLCFLYNRNKCYICNDFA